MPIRQYVSLLGTTFPFYGLCVGLALLAIGIWIIYNFKKFKMDGDLQNEILYGFPFMVLTGLFFAFALDALFLGLGTESGESVLHSRVGCLALFSSYSCLVDSHRLDECFC